MIDIEIVTLDSDKKNFKVSILIYRENKTRPMAVMYFFCFLFLVFFVFF